MWEASGRCASHINIAWCRYHSTSTMKSSTPFARRLIWCLASLTKLASSTIKVSFFFFYLEIIIEKCLLNFFFFARSWFDHSMKILTQDKLEGFQFFVKFAILAILYIAIVVLICSIYVLSRALLGLSENLQDSLKSIDYFQFLERDLFGIF